ncbi:MAG TPA: hypothetical protein VNZ44_00215, partial [Pyrinomonadaceae bacterium]|nr:hypothetical protein [Pyrinomonadaceae bacterium]
MRLSHKTSLVKGFISLSLAAASLAGSVATTRVGAQSGGAAPSAAAERSPLSRYAIELTRLARLGRLSSSEEHAAEVTKAVEALAGGPKSPVLLGETGAAAVAKGIARRVAAGEVPASLSGAKVYALR